MRSYRCRPMHGASETVFDETCCCTARSFPSWRTISDDHDPPAQHGSDQRLIAAYVRVRAGCCCSRTFPICVSGRITNIYRVALCYRARLMIVIVVERVRRVWLHALIWVWGMLLGGRVRTTGYLLSRTHVDAIVDDCPTTGGRLRRRACVRKVTRISWVISVCARWRRVQCF